MRIFFAPGSYEAVDTHNIEILTKVGLTPQVGVSVPFNDPILSQCCHYVSHSDML